MYQKNSDESQKTQSHLGQNAIFQERFYEKARQILRETFDVIDRKNELKVEKILFFANKGGTSL